MSKDVPSGMADRDDPTETFEVVPNGDLLLMAGAKEVPILVSSHCFKTASKPFAAMLQPVFHEGVAFAACQSSLPFRLKLPEDDAQALKLLSQIPHFKAPITEETCHETAHLMVKLTILADKYDCIQAIYFYVGLWAKSLSSFYGPALCVAYLIDNARLFHELSRSMILTEAPLSISSRRVLDPLEVLPVDTWIAIAEQQRKVWSTINEEVVSFLQYDDDSTFGASNFLLLAHGDGSFTASPASWFSIYAHDGKDPDLGCDKCAPARSLAKMAFMNYLSMSGIWPLAQDTSIQDLLQTLDRNLRAHDMEQFRAAENKWVAPQSVCGCKLADCASLLAKIHGRATDAASGICMDCIKGSEREACRVSH